MHTTQCSTCIMEVVFVISLKTKTILIYQSVFSQIPASLCHSGLITLSQTNQFSESCIVINIRYPEFNQPTNLGKIHFARWNNINYFIIFKI